MAGFRLGTLLLLLVFLSYGYLTTDIRLDFWAESELFNARTFPYLICITAIILCVLILVFSKADPLNVMPSRTGIVRAVLLLSLTFLYGLCLDQLGFMVTSTIFLISAFIILGERNWIRMFAIAASVVVTFWILMDSLDIYLAPGSWWEMLN